MKIVILITSAEELGSEGVRIRYLRLRDALESVGVSLSVTPIDAFNPLTDKCDVVLVSKCYDARALVVACALSNRGIRVGLDLFDDYFSESADSRLRPFRSWLRQMLRLSRCAICSTAEMA